MKWSNYRSQIVSALFIVLAVIVAAIMIPSVQASQGFTEYDPPENRLYIIQERQFVCGNWNSIVLLEQAVQEDNSDIAFTLFMNGHCMRSPHKYFGGIVTIRVTDNNSTLALIRYHALDSWGNLQEVDHWVTYYYGE